MVGPPAAETALARQQAAIVAALVGLSALVHFNRTCMSVAGNLLIESKQLTEEQMGLVYSTLLIVYTLCMTPAGWLTDVIGGRRTIALVGLGSALFCLATGGAGWWSGSGALVPGPRKRWRAAAWQSSR